MTTRGPQPSPTQPTVKTRYREFLNFESESPLSVKIRFDNGTLNAEALEHFTRAAAATGMELLEAGPLRSLPMGSRLLLAFLLTCVVKIRKRRGLVPLIGGTVNLGVTQDDIAAYLGRASKKSLRTDYANLCAVGVTRPSIAERWRGHGYFSRGATWVVDLAALLSWLPVPTRTRPNQRAAVGKKSPLKGSCLDSGVYLDCSGTAGKTLPHALTEDPDLPLVKQALATGGFDAKLPSGKTDTTYPQRLLEAARTRGLSTDKLIAGIEATALDKRTAGGTWNDPARILMARLTRSSIGEGFWQDALAAKVDLERRQRARKEIAKRHAEEARARDAQLQREAQEFYATKRAFEREILDLPEAQRQRLLAAVAQKSSICADLISAFLADEKSLDNAAYPLAKECVGKLRSDGESAIGVDGGSHERPQVRDDFTPRWLALNGDERSQLVDRALSRMDAWQASLFRPRREWLLEGDRARNIRSVLLPLLNEGSQDPRLAAGEDRAPAIRCEGF